MPYLDLQDIDLYHGAYHIIDAPLLDDDGSPLPINEGDALQFVIARNPRWPPTVQKQLESGIEVDEGQTHVTYIEIDPDDYGGLNARLFGYAWAAWYTPHEGKRVPVGIGRVIVHDTVKPAVA